MLTSQEKQIYSDKILKLRQRPDLFIQKILGEDTLEQYHIDICNLLVEHDRLLIKACHAVGKTWIMGRATLWFLNCYRQSMIITTAPTNRQVETLLWGEIRKAFRRSKTRLGGKLLTKKLTIDDDWYAMGFSPQSGKENESNEQQSSSFQGFHAKYVLIIFDEAVGVPKDIWTMAEGLVTSGVVVKWVCIANPTSTASEFFRATKLAEWYTHTITCFHSPNMIANGFVDRVSLQKELDELRLLPDMERLKRIKNYAKPNGVLLSAQWAVAKLYQWGFDHPLAKSKILGEFPDKNDNTVIKYDSVLAAQNREPKFDYVKRYLGVDVARYGDDLTVLVDLTDSTFREKQVFMKEDTEEVAGRVTNLLMVGDTGKETHVVIDATGVGSGVVDKLKANKREGILGKNIHIHEVHFGNKIRISGEESIESVKAEALRLNNQYENLKAYMFDLLNQDLRDHLQIPQEEIFEEELPSIMFKFSRKGRLMIESKDDYKQRTGKSPDHADALALANYARYLIPSHGSFIGMENTNIQKSFRSSQKANENRKSRIKINSY